MKALARATRLAATRGAGRYRRAAAALGLAAAGLALSSGCATNPVTGRSEMRFVSEAQEIDLGRQSYGNMSQAQGGDLAAFPEVEAYVSRVGRSLAKVSDRPTLPYEFKVLNNEVPNAWALPGGKIAVNRGLLVELESEAELAAVLAHEIVHAAARHGAKSMERGMLMQAGVLGLGMAIDSHDYRDLILGTAGISAQLVGLKYSREAEREADYYGMKYMAAAGYDPQAAVDLQETFVRLAEEGESNWLTGLFASHPPSRERVEANRARLRELPPGGRLGKEEYARIVGPLRRAQTAYGKQAQGYQALQQGDSRQALRLARQAIEAEPGEARFYGLAAKAMAAAGDTVGAREMLAKAISLNSDYYDFYLQRGLLEQAEGGDPQKARRDFSRSLSLLPTAQAHYALGVLDLGRRDEEAALQHLRTAASASSETGQAARELYTRLELPRQPQDFIQVRVQRDRKGYLRVTAANRSLVPVYDIQVAVEILQKDRVYRSTVSLPNRLEPGESATSLTTIGPFGSDEMVQRNVRFRVASASVAR
jgi:predicted Zn-dependent protease